MAAEHDYRVTVRWQGNLGTGTSGVRDFSRVHEVRAQGKPALAASADPQLRGDADRWNPEELLVAALSQCHMLWFLHLAALAGVVVTGYTDTAAGTMVMERSGGGRFTKVVLRPVVEVTQQAMSPEVPELHDKAGQMCFIARSVNFPVECEVQVRVAAQA
ncbi:MAG: OsmC family protein [Candidatus Dormibacteraeota bacterium]|nr:OsmC family protein [Candidatus Dormibacteraeota bacterium]